MQISIDGIVLSAGLPDGLDDMVASHLKAVLALHEGDPLTAYTEQLAMLAKVLEVFEREGMSWMHTTLRSVIADSRKVVDYAEKESARIGKPLHGDALVRLG